MAHGNKAGASCGAGRAMAGAGKAGGKAGGAGRDGRAGASGKGGGFAAMLRGLDEGRQARLAAKLPSWSAASERSGRDFTIPSDLCLEQCSSEATALHKATVLRDILARTCTTLSPGTDKNASLCFRDTGGIAGNALHDNVFRKDVSLDGFTVADLTGGFGVDSWAFAQVGGHVHYFERNAELAEAVRGNFSVLGCDSVEVHCEETTAATIDALPSVDAIFIDPARRSATGSKVFLLEDCTPDVLTLLPAMCRKASVIMLKLSPMADITMVVRRLESVLATCATSDDFSSQNGSLSASNADCSLQNGSLPASNADCSCTMHVRQVRVVGAAGEVKELLVVIVKNQSEGYDIHVDDADTGESFNFCPDDESSASLVMASAVEPGSTLLEPKPVLMKAGYFKLPCTQIGAAKLGRDCHLYVVGKNDSANVCDITVDGIKNTVDGAELNNCSDLLSFYKAFQIIEVLPMGNAAIREVGQKYPVAEVSAKGLHLSSDELRARIGCKSGIAPDGRHIHIFGCGTAVGKLLIVTCN